MTAAATFDIPARLLAVVRARRVAIVVVAGAAVLVAATAVAWRLGGGLAASLVALVAVAATAIVAMLRARAVTRDAIVHQLDAGRADLEDSSDLLAADASRLGPLQRLQQARVRERLEARAADLRAPWPLRGLVATWLVALLVAGVALAWPRQPSLPSTGHARVDSTTTAATATEIRLQDARLRIAPPAYTGIAASESPRLAARVPAGATLRWQLRLQPAPGAAELRFIDGRRIPLVRDGDAFTATTTADRSGLYRIVPTGTLPLVPDALHRIDVVPDRAPTVRVLAPAQSLSLRTDGQSRWALRFEARDDHAVAPRARLLLTLAQGTGENVAFREETRVLTGSGPATRRTFAHAVDLAALGLSPGDDVIARLEVTDTRAPSPQPARSASVILRWPAQAEGMATGVEGLVNDVMPAYFRSQRQIIIDAEALIAKRRTLSDDAFTARSDAIGVDQRLLRLRYGQFLGEESEGAPQQRRLMPTVDAEAEAGADGGDAHAGHDGDAAHDQDPLPVADAGEGDARAANDTGDAHGHDHAGEPPAEPEAGAGGFGRAGNLLEEFGHAHDTAEAATLLDPDTRALLKSALDEMWQSELRLRTAKPSEALPFANRALELVKQVQQASRIYLARVGNTQPPIDFGRRMGGKRDGIASARWPALAAAERDDAPARLWRALDAGDDAAVVDAIDGLGDWLRARDGDDAALTLSAALDAVRRDPRCMDCRDALRRALWPVLQAPPSAPRPRTPADATGRAYLDALRREGATR